MNSRVDVKVLWNRIPVVVEVPLEDGRKVLVPGWVKGKQRHLSWEKVAHEDVEQAKARQDLGVVVSFGS
jgi:hypothetical protein